MRAVPTFAAEPARAGDPALDFCLWPYDLPSPRHATSLAGANLLYAASAEAGCLDAYCSLTESLRAALGPFRSVWGVKWDGR
ncbi:MAG TPA: hypothetical protein VHV26_17090, partial [Rhizomicrobium sp.]|nr:hypothetical protein [Rhizomicrobium sp.]